MKIKIIYSIVFAVGLVVSAAAGRVNNSAPNGCCCRQTVHDTKPHTPENTKEFNVSPMVMLFGTV